MNFYLCKVNETRIYSVEYIVVADSIEDAQKQIKLGNTFQERDERCIDTTDVSPSETPRLSHANFCLLCSMPIQPESAYCQSCDKKLDFSPIP